MLVKSKRNKRYTKNKIEAEKASMRGLLYYVIVEMNRENRNMNPHDFSMLLMEAVKKLKLQSEDMQNGVVYEEGKPSFCLQDAIGWAYATFAMFDGLTKDTDFMKVMEERANAVLN